MNRASTLLGEIRAAGERFAARDAADPDRYPAESVDQLVDSFSIDPLEHA